MSEWQPIATLPHDGTPEDQVNCGKWHGPVLVFVPTRFGGVQLVAQMDSDMWLYGPDDDHAYAELATEPTYWMPLPPPPSSEEQT